MSDFTFEIPITEEPSEFVVVSSLAAGRLITGFSVRFNGWCLKNTSGSTLASIDIYDGADTNGRLAFPLNLAANEVSVVWFGDRGIHFKNGVYFNVTAQTIQGSLFYRHLRL